MHVIIVSVAPKGEDPSNAMRGLCPAYIDYFEKLDPADLSDLWKELIAIKTVGDLKRYISESDRNVKIFYGMAEGEGIFYWNLLDVMSLEQLRNLYLKFLANYSDDDPAECFDCHV